MVSEKDKEQEELESAFKVTDRRQFTSEGEKRPSAPESSESPEKISEKPSEEPAKADDSPDATTASEKPSEEPAKADDSPDVATASEKPPESPETIDFAQFVYSLATTTMVHLGEIAEPTTGQKMENLEVKVRRHIKPLLLVIQLEIHLKTRLVLL